MFGAVISLIMADASGSDGFKLVSVGELAY